MLRMRRGLLVAIAGLALAGCFSVGSKWTADQVRQLKPGMTMDDVLTIMGKPYQVTAGIPSVGPDGQPNGSKTIATWVHVDGLAGSQQLILTFGTDGRLESVPATYAASK